MARWRRRLTLTLGKAAHLCGSPVKEAVCARLHCARGGQGTPHRLTSQCCCPAARIRALPREAGSLVGRDSVRVALPKRDLPPCSERVRDDQQPANETQQ